VADSIGESDRKDEGPRRRLLIVTFDPPENVGGIEGRSRTYATELSKRGHQVGLVSFSSVSPPFRPAQVGYISIRFDSSVLRLPPAMIATLRLIRKRTFQCVLLVSGSLTIYGLYLLTLCWALRIRSVAFFYGRDVLSAKKNVLRSFLLTCALNLADRIAVNSNFTKGTLPRGVFKVVLVRPAIAQEMLEAAKLSRSEESGGKILFVGRLIERKGVDVLLRALAELAIQKPDAMLDIVGDGPLKPSLQDLSRRLGVDTRVRFHGALSGSQLYGKFALSDVLVMPSRGTADDVEGFGTVFIEAGVFGKPVIGTKTGGIPEAVLDGGTGLLVPDGDSHALSEALLRVLGDQGLRTRLGLEGHKRAISEFTLAHAVDTIEQIIQE
jgi:glycosyltransferase involved in cell wall biosynthesis